MAACATAPNPFAKSGIRRRYHVGRTIYGVQSDKIECIVGFVGRFFKVPLAHLGSRAAGHKELGHVRRWDPQNKLTQPLCTFCFVHVVT